MDPIIYAIPVFLLTLLLEVAAAHLMGKKVYYLPDAITSLHIGILSQITGVFAKIANIGLYVLMYEQFATTPWSLQSTGQWLLALLIYDFLYYWKHRLGHEVNILWAWHVTHHSSEYYNLSTALRQSSTNPLLGWIFFLPMAVMGVPPKMFVAVGLINLLYQYWVHTELIGKLGWMEYAMVTPSNHRVHHGQNDYCIDVNYGGIFIVWDRLFGTYASERDGEKICYGIRHPLNSLNPVWANLHYYVELWQLSGQAKGIRAKMDVWLGPPGGWTDQPLSHFDASGFSRYDTGTPRKLRGYVVIHYAMLIPVLAHFLYAFPIIDAAQAVLYALWIAAALVALCLLLQGVQWGKRLEQARLLCVGVGALTSPQWIGADGPIAMRIALAMLALASLIWVSLQDMNFTVTEGMAA